ncbi:PLP-dependent aminotransferase family protein [Fodinicola acaciae]|uniref:aminotransferase-like domain-containing protein n=1 Tax=Fodinicola acaciae TaxID=2681555 RepID=UPI0013D61298|nr:PLP-dependent aminotransferase family protein [Fodinicola acaciae]
MEPIELTERLGRWSSGRGPLYLLLAARMRELIDEGELPAGEPLPADRVLAGALAVGRTTVVAAYEQLRVDGRIVRRQGSGTKVTGDPRPVATTTAAPMFLYHLEKQDDETILFACAAPDEPPQEVADAYALVASRLREIRRDIGYFPAGRPELREAIAQRYSRRGVPTEPADVLVTNGGQQALSLLARAFVRPGDRVVLEAPTYPGALETLREQAPVFRALPPGLPGFRGVVGKERPALAYVIPTFHNPTGFVLSTLERQRLAAEAEAAGVPLVADDVPADLAFPGEQTPPLMTGAAVINLGSLSKSVWGGLRIGWIRAPAPLIARLARIRAVQDIGGDTPAQLAAAEIFHRLDEICARRAPELQRRHDALVEDLSDALPEWHVPAVRGGQTLWVRLPCGDGDSFAQAAMRHGVAVLAGSGLDVSGASADRIRLHFRLPAEVQADAVRRLAAAWRTYRPPDIAVPGRAALAV